jgi:predicted short-subunit dehydrogenase-like oxidoreductase (DUF2520 family)
LVLLTVPDEAIAAVCGELAAAGALRPGAIVAHCSGALGSDALAAARDRCGCAVGSLHPLQTFPSPDEGVRRFDGTYCFIEGDPPAVETLERFAAAIGGVPVRIAPQAKPLYHAAAVMACNALAALLDAAEALAAAAGIDRETFRAAMAPLVRATVDNVLSTGPAAALTGPVARGDVRTVRGHLAALAGVDAGLDRLYRAAGRRTVALAQRKRTLDEQTARQLLGLLDEPARASRR